VGGGIPRAWRWHAESQRGDYFRPSSDESARCWPVYRHVSDFSPALWRRTVLTQGIANRFAPAALASCDRDPEKSNLEPGGRAVLWGLYERGHCQARFLGPFTFVHSFVRPEEPILSSRPWRLRSAARKICQGRRDNAAQRACP